MNKLDNNQILSLQAIEVNKIYRHYSGKFYTIIAIARDSENPDVQHVVYQGLYECDTFGPCPIWVRPYTMFIENVIVDGIKQPRFQEVLYDGR